MEDVDEQADDIYNGILGEIGLEYVENDPVSYILLIIKIKLKGSNICLLLIALVCCFHVYLILCYYRTA